MPVTISGTSGVESPGYTQDGDPIVESGSNSDGEWTRWADGTQICQTAQVLSGYGSSLLTEPLHATSGFSWTMPATFTNQFSVTGMVGSGHSNTWVTLGGAPWTESTIGYQVMRTASMSNTLSVRLHATGRWK